MKRRWMFAGIGVVVIAAVVVLVVVLSRGPDTSTPEGAAAAAVDAFADKDSEALTAVSCAGAANPLDQVAPAPMVGAELGEVRTDGTDKAVADVSVTYLDTTTRKTEMGLSRENGEWCLAWFGE